MRRLSFLMVLVGVLAACPTFSLAQSLQGWEQAQVIAAPEAVQAAASNGDDIYAIAGDKIAKYNRKTGQRVAVSTGPATHLNSGFFHDGKLYCAHSNFPKKPERSEIKVLDPETMELTEFKNFGETSHGSLTWAVLHEGHWWCTFARYGADNSQTALVKYDFEWREVGQWRYPKSVVSDLGRNSISGGLWWKGRLLATGHDNPVVYVLQLPETGHVLQHRETLSVPFTGQGIAADGANDLIGIHRPRKQVLIAHPQ